MGSTPIGLMATNVSLKDSGFLDGGRNVRDTQGRLERLLTPEGGPGW